MKKTEIVFVRGVGKETVTTTIPAVALNVKYGEKPIVLVSNVLQNFIKLDEAFVPDKIRNQILRQFYTKKGTRLIEIEDLVYATKYWMYNGEWFPMTFMKIVAKLEETVIKIKTTDLKDKIFAELI